MSFSLINHDQKPDVSALHPGAQSGQSSIRALLDRYRCGDRISRYFLRGNLARGVGYFRLENGSLYLGHNLGDSVGSPGKDEILVDLSKAGPGGIELPFDPDEIIENLRLERYCLNTAGLSSPLARGTWIRRGYYLLRPLLSVNARKHLQRIALRDWSERKFPSWPVDRTVEGALEKVLLSTMRVTGIETVPFIWFWPDGHSSCAMMTHDVETETGRRFCSELMDIDDAFGIKASFQVIPEERYVITNAYLDSIRSRGFEVVVHDWNHDGHLFRDRARFLVRAKQINRFAKEHNAKGFRAGMLYRNVDWFDAFELEYDMSIPNVAHLDPQRGGCCTVFPYFIGDILELPVTTTQDYSLFHILNQYSIGLWKQQCDLILEVNGMMSFIAHPDYLLERRARRIYECLLTYLADLRATRNVWIALPGDVNEWWRQRSQMMLVSENRRLRIMGPGCERARVAYARVEGDHLVYSLESSQ